MIAILVVSPSPRTNSATLNSLPDLWPKVWLLWWAPPGLGAPLSRDIRPELKRAQVWQRCHTILEDPRFKPLLRREAGRERDAGGRRTGDPGGHRVGGSSLRPRDGLPGRSSPETDAEARLSFGDRACLAFGGRLGWPVLTTDRDWKKLDVGVEVRAIR